MKTREEIRTEISNNNKAIESLRLKNLELKKKDLLLSDEEQWYIEESVTRGRGKNKVTRIEGKICWEDYFLDEDTGKKIKIKRSSVVKINGEWVA